VLARVAAVVRHTPRRCGTTDEFVKAIESRIHNCSRSSGVGLTDLIHRQLAPSTTDANTAISGSDIMLTSAQPKRSPWSFTNWRRMPQSTGALSGTDGKVWVSWDCTSAIERLS
jgi:hypothetical protein